MMKKIDSHIHLWDYTAEEYGWIPDGPVQRSFHLHHYPTEDQVILVQARQCLEENDYLLEAAASPQVAGVVGWADLMDPDMEASLQPYLAQTKFKGIRHIRQGEESATWYQQPSVVAGVQKVGELGLVFDLLVYHHQLPDAIALVDAAPNTTFVLDHIGKPAIQQGELEPWATHLRQLAQRPHVHCKLSGLITEAAPHQQAPSQFLPYLSTALEAFGPQRLLWGSDWPVCLLAGGYPHMQATAHHLVGTLSSTEQQAIYSENARRVYKIEP